MAAAAGGSPGFEVPCAVTGVPVLFFFATEGSEMLFCAGPPSL